MDIPGISVTRHAACVGRATTVTGRTLAASILVAATSLAGGEMRTARADGGNLGPWTQTTSLPLAVAFPIVTQTGGKVRVVAGVPQAYADATYYNQVFDVTTATWSADTSFVSNRDSGGAAGAALPDGRVVVRVGSGTQTTDYYTTTAYIGRHYIYTPTTHGWGDGLPYAPSDQYRSSAVTASDGNIYFIGGDRSNDHSGTVVDLYTAATGGWSSVASLPTGLISPAVAADGTGHIYAVGGQTEGTTTSVVTFKKIVFIYTIATNTWTTLKALPHALGGASAMMEQDGKLYVIGGEDNTGGLSSVYSFDPGVSVALNTVFTAGHGSWASENPLPAPVADAGATITADGTIYVAGGTPNGLRDGYPDFKALATVYSARLMTGAPPAGSGASTPELGNGELVLLAALPCLVLIVRRSG